MNPTSPSIFVFWLPKTNPNRFWVKVPLCPRRSFVQHSSFYFYTCSQSMYFMAGPLKTPTTDCCVRACVFFIVFVFILVVAIHPICVTVYHSLETLHTRPEMLKMIHFLARVFQRAVTADYAYWCGRWRNADVCLVMKHFLPSLLKGKLWPYSK